ncbi:uncharacterized protein PV09_01855 [Verruconis gallopava]|uniref:Uncharacterized protein n=1 Tax=Verruconis gallopava TaxID=253628 RepID=A0A0D2B9P8_9PEZI|nr:uncharacterized protein PV09_01855 [Verruconis gallopava]KIW07954.1 hypothetical protein PV09_01855 [Verruconis gallopava]
MPFIHDAMDEKINPQNASLFFSRLPGELRNQIYELAMTADKPIVDPTIPPTYTAFAKAMGYRTDHHRVPDLSTQLLRTCKRMHMEISVGPLYANNTFRFTTSFSADKFLSALPHEYRGMIQDVEVDLREVNDAHPAVEREWIQYLSWKPQVDSFRATKVGSLRSGAPNVRTLRINIECWRVQEMMRSVALLKELLQGPHKLQRIVMTGVDGSELLFGSRERYLEKWGPVAFVGVMRFARLAGMTEWMANAVEGEKEDKVVMWEKKGPCVNLEIMTGSEYRLQTGKRASWLEKGATYNPLKGVCLLDAYEQRWHSGEWPRDGGY